MIEHTIHLPIVNIFFYLEWMTIMAFIPCLAYNVLNKAYSILMYLQYPMTTKEYNPG